MLQIYTWYDLSNINSSKLLSIWDKVLSFAVIEVKHELGSSRFV